MYINYKRIRKKNQDWQKKDCWPSDQIVKDRESYFHYFSVIENKILDTLLYLHYKYRGNIVIRQGYLGSLVGISREWCNKILFRFEQAGLILSNYRHMRSSQYKLSSWFHNSSVTSALSHIFKSIRIPLMVAMFPNSAPALDFHRPFTRSKVSSITSYYNYRISKGSDVIFGQNDYLGQRVGDYFRKNRYIFVESHDRKALYFKKGDNVTLQNPISLAIREIKSLSLTKWGQIRLSCFPDEAIKHADGSFKFAYNLKNPFGFFVQLCQQYCKTNDLIPDWNFYSRLAQKYEMPSDAPMLMEPVAPIKKDFNYLKHNEVKSSSRVEEYCDQNRRFKTLCEMNHEAELEKLTQQLENIDLPQFANPFGLDYAKSYVIRMIDNHRLCLNSNHVQL